MVSTTNAALCLITFLLSVCGESEEAFIFMTTYAFIIRTTQTMMFVTSDL